MTSALAHDAWLQTASGRAFDLLAPTPAMVDFTVDIPEALARIARFTGHVRAGPYSVAQHSVIGADHLFEATGDPILAAHFLLHDAHEAYLGDIATPIQSALCTEIDDASPERPRLIHDDAARARLRGLRRRIDAAIFAAAGIDPPTDVQKSAIKNLDMRMLALERRHLLGASPRPWGADIEKTQPIARRGRLTVWPWPKAADAFRQRLAWLPALRHLSTSP